MPPTISLLSFYRSTAVQTIGRSFPLLLLIIAVAMPTVASAQKKKKNHTEWKSGVQWTEPAKVEPGENGAPPSDAIVLFDGTNLDQWINGDHWKIQDGVATVAGAAIFSKQSFGSCQLHLEFSSPEEDKGEGQGKGNSGVFFGNGYEVQVLDAYENKTYFDGQCGALYKQQPPLVNPTKAPGQWQTYDIVYEAPQFGSYGEVVRPVYLTVLLNGVLVQNHVALKGRTLYNAPPTYEAHPEKMPISLQWHNDPVRYRNIWIRELEPPQAGTHPETPRWAAGDSSEDHEAAE